MSVNVFIILFLIFILYFLSEKQSVAFEIIFLTFLVFFGPDILFNDIENYVKDIMRDYPEFYFVNIKNYILILQSSSYILLYYLVSKFLIYKDYRFLFLNLTLGTLAYSQFFLCVSILFFVIQHNTKNKYLRSVLVLISLAAHVSVLVLYLYYLYDANKKLLLIFTLTFLSANLFFNFSVFNFFEFDSRFYLYNSQFGDNVFSTYSLRSHRDLHFLMLIISILHSNIRLMIYVSLVFIFTLIFKEHVHAVFITRTLELFYILYVLILPKEKRYTSQFSKISYLLISVYFVNNFFQAYLFN